MKNPVLYSFLLLLLSMTVSACGVKPSEVDPPAGYENQTYPQTYPDPATDPSPDIKPDSPPPAKRNTGTVQF